MSETTRPRFLVRIISERIARAVPPEPRYFRAEENYDRRTDCLDEENGFIAHHLQCDGGPLKLHESPLILRPRRPLLAVAKRR